MNIGEVMNESYRSEVGQPSGRGHDWILTASGRQFYPLNPVAEDVCIEDIAHALSLKCRFGGHCNEFYSVAQHSVLVSEYVAAHGAGLMAQLAALLHDAAEAYLPDIAKPIKHRVILNVAEDPREHLLTMFSGHEGEVLLAIWRALGIDAQTEEESRLIKEADIVMLMTERRDLMTQSGPEWTLKSKQLWNKIHAQPPRQARDMFLVRYQRLTRLLAEKKEQS